MWAVAIKGDRSQAELKAATEELAICYPFKVPATSLRVGTLDSLMSLSDDLTKMELLAEGTHAKLSKQLTDLKPDEEPTITGVPVLSYTTMQWEWDEAKFQLKAPLRELCETISQRISSVDDELKIKVSEINTVRGVLQGAERKTQGNLMVRGLADIINEQDVMESDYMTTVYTVVPKAGIKEFEGAYEKMATYVVPKSAKLLAEDTEYGLFSTILFKKSLDEFKGAAREKRFTMREFTYKAGTVAEEERKKFEDSAEYERLKAILTNWCQINFSEVLSAPMASLALWDPVHNGRGTHWRCAHHGLIPWEAMVVMARMRFGEEAVARMAPHLP